MAFSSSSSSVSAAPNVTPLIDVLLVLLIIFMVIVPVSPRGLGAALPQPSPASARQEIKPLILDVLPGEGAMNPRVHYRLNARELNAGELDTALRTAAMESFAQPVFVRGDHRLDYQAIAAVIGLARRAGFSSVGLLPMGR